MSEDPPKRITIRDVAERAGVSHPTVSRALKGSPLVNKKTRDHIQRVADELGYTPDPMLSALVNYRNNFVSHNAKVRIAIVFREDLSEFYSACSEVAQEQAARLGYDFEIYIWDPETSAQRHSQILKSRGIKGIILGPLTHDFAMEHPEISWDEFAVITIGRFIASPKLDSVSEDHFQAVRLCLEAAYSKGYERPGLLTNKRINIRAQDRIRGAFDSHMLKLPAAQRVSPFIGESDYTMAQIKTWMQRERVDVIIGHRHIGRRLESEGLRIPGDISFIAFDKQTSQTGGHRFAGATHDDLEIARLAINNINNHIISGKFGIPRSPQAILLETYWSDGESFPKT